MKRESHEVDGYSHGNNPIPAVARIGDIVVTGGISGIDLSTGTMPATVEEQSANMFHVAKKVLQQAGAGLSDVIKVTVFLKPELNRAALNTAWLEHFPDEHSRPVRHVIVNPYLAGGMLIQCEMMAVLDSSVK